MIYDIYGNPVSAGSNTGGTVSGTVGLANLSAELINKIIVTDENTKIYNLLDISKVSVGRFQGFTFNQYYTSYRASDYIEVSAGQTYVAQSWDTSGNTGYDCVVLYDSSKNPLKTYTTKGDGSIRYSIFTPDQNGYIRYCYTYSETANPMVYIGAETTDVFVEYTGETLNGTMEYLIADIFKGMIRRDVEPSNLYGKTVYIIGDSNADNWYGSVSEKLRKRYGCNVMSFAKYGATWATSSDASDTASSNAIGQWNAFVSTVGITDEDYLFPDDTVLLFMMGTNAGNGTFDAANEDVTTPGGAINYILKRAKYYGRNISIGVFLPWCAANNDQLKKAADYYKIPTFDIPAIIIDDVPTNGLVRPDGTSVSKNYYTDGGNHLSAWGWDMFVRIAHPWIAYCI